MNSEPKYPWRLDTNDRYRELVSAILSLSTAALLLPVFFAREFLGVPETKPLIGIFSCETYWAWALLGASILSSICFFSSRQNGLGSHGNSQWVYLQSQSHSPSWREHWSCFCGSLSSAFFAASHLHFSFLSAMYQAPNYRLQATRTSGVASSLFNAFSWPLLRSPEPKR
jgi:hypothetical protein